MTFESRFVQPQIPHFPTISRRDFKGHLHAKLLQSCLTLCNPMDCSPQAPLSMGFSRQEYWNGLPCPPPGNLSNPGIEPMSFMSPALADKFFTTSTTMEASKVV